jgi:RNA polymerase sigma-70 factor (ECF subfamily)
MPMAEHDARSDEILMAHYTAGDAGAFDALFARYESRAYAYFRKRAGSRERAQDLYQELFLRVHRSRDSYDPERPFTPWFFQIAHRIWIDDIRRAHRAHEVALDEHELHGAIGVAECVSDREDLARALDALSSEERFVLISAKLEGRPYGELAKALGKSADAVKKLASRALQRLRSETVDGAEPARARAS